MESQRILLRRWQRERLRQRFVLPRMLSRADYKARQVKKAMVMYVALGF